MRSRVSENTSDREVLPRAYHRGRVAAQRDGAKSPVLDVPRVGPEHRMDKDLIGVEPET